MTTAGQGSVRAPRRFGRRTEPVSITIQRHGHARQYRVNGLLAGILVSMVAMFGAGQIAATTYLALRDDLVELVRTRNVRAIHDYEDRIAALRIGLDKALSRQLLDQRAIEERMAELAERHEALTRQTARLAPAARATQADAPVPSPRPVASPAPLQTGALAEGPAAVFASMGALRGATPAPGRDVAPVLALVDPAADEHGRSHAHHAAVGLDDMTREVGTLETAQLRALDTLGAAVDARVGTITRVLASLSGLPPRSKRQVGGPFVPVPADAPFEERLKALDQGMARLETLEAQVRPLPLGHPTPGRAQTSGFGVRVDPFLDRPALHGGLDFKAGVGDPVRTAAPGTVLSAGWNGGYGMMVEVDHGGGLTTRYAHLSRLDVAAGQTVAAGTILGRAGSTGRSTGPHLHYEVRRNGKAVDPLPYLQAGRLLRSAS